MASGVAVEVSEIASERGIRTVVLSGGVFQNVLFTDLLTADLERRGLDVRSHRLVPPNDGGLALGQVMVARARVDRDRALSVPTINQTAGV
jgi:hydrogenase maturation protein HypF